MSLQTDSKSSATTMPRFEGDAQRYLRGLGGLTAFLIVWWIGAMMTQPSYLVPGPVASVRAFVDLFATSTAIVVPVLGSEMVLPTGLAHLAGLIALVVNIFSAALGHGAVGLLGANTLVNATEAIVAYYAFKALMGMDWDVFPASASAATLGLSAGAVLMGAIIVISGVNGSALPRGDLTIAVAGLVGLNLGVAVIEGILTGFVVQFLASVRPDLVGLTDQETREESTGVTA
ncbi:MULTISPECIES: energy-coupling factor ABC transporter permease [unclassified Haloferax]|jgi:ABC-type Co2+ transport system permease subunit|uniref:Energy-coupling factor ABC transporter permease n=1 Tax=Haloferax sp. Atlit-48N TaxID=2077198 RepID=A0ACD5I086_9EURY|nr:MULTISPECIES: energy-coupling factor ABC transporter permease [unclassified Haloferax]RDZ30380.1 nitrate ABC transporter permease [Haloferax sp. Atlit-48N]RDZ33993.1 nitrate ABC transporter permease [Haloferax sp. Atlit-24N]RDZ35686.1 nitrate ABC transporter permease [Haloferax sp. Atlit-47N]RLM33598.1 ABC transporter permease [Haloferax sp. Atlit-109R]RLM40823.1 ABC transporter permease [Haloferax sp. Atlit-105R]